MSAHTPGPWVAFCAAGEWAIKSSVGKYIGGLMIGGAECRANARLIAAAPDLLRVLTMVCKTLPHIGGNASSVHSMLKDINGAIARATNP